MQPITLFQFICHFIKKKKFLFFFIQFLFFAWAIDNTIIPLIFGKFIDALSGYKGDKQYAWAAIKMPIYFAITVFIYTELSFRVGGFLKAYSFPKLSADIRMYLFSQVQKQGVDYFTKNFSGVISNKISDLSDGILRILNIIYHDLTTTLLGIIIASIIFLMLHPVLSFLLFLWSFLHLGICFYFSKYAANLSHIHAESRSQLNGRIVDSFSNFLNVILFSGKLFEKRYIQKFQDKELLLHRNEHIYVEKVRIILGLLGFVFPGFLIMYFSYQFWKKDIISGGDIVIIISTTWQIITMVWSLGMHLPDLFKDIGICKQALEIIQSDVKIKDIKNAKKINIKKGKIEFRDVDFHYDNAPNLFIKKSLKINPGEKIGLVGKSGAGKSSLIKIILRLYEVSNGKILIDDQDISKVSLESLYENIAVIPQDPILFHRSVMDNIKYSKLDATKEEVLKAAKLAHVDEFIKDYDMIVGEKGSTLSGGQKQRIVLARAFLKKSKILILDEATSALDSKTESYVQDSIKKLMKNQTVIAIAHRLSTLKIMDRVLVLDNGQIVDDGTHDELIKKEGIYKMLWDAQVGGYIQN